MSDSKVMHLEFGTPKIASNQQTLEEAGKDSCLEPCGGARPSPHIDFWLLGPELQEKQFLLCPQLAVLCSGCPGDTRSRPLCWAGPQKSRRSTPASSVLGAPLSLSGSLPSPGSVCRSPQLTHTFGDKCPQDSKGFL